MSYRYTLPTVGVVLIGYGIAGQGWFGLLAWLGTNFCILGLAHVWKAPAVFGKRIDGTLPWWSWLLFLPMHGLTQSVWHLVRRLSREPAYNEVTGNLIVGRRLLTSEMGDEFDNYVDLTAEFTEPAKARCSPAYFCFPILDGAAPEPDALLKAVAELRPGKTFVHCAQGHGRTGLFALAILLASGAAGSVEEGLRQLAKTRPSIRLNKGQLRCARAYAQLVWRATR